MKELREWLQSIGQKYSLKELRHLQCLHIDNLSLPFIHENIYKLKNLQELYVYNKVLKSLPESIGRLKNLVGIVLYCDKLKSLPTSIVNLNKLEWIYLHNNPALTLTMQQVSFLSKIKQHTDLKQFNFIINKTLA